MDLHKNIGKILAMRFKEHPFFFHISKKFVYMTYSTGVFNSFSWKTETIRTQYLQPKVSEESLLQEEHQE